MSKYFAANPLRATGTLLKHKTIPATSLVSQLEEQIFKEIVTFKGQKPPRGKSSWAKFYLADPEPGAWYTGKFI